MGAGGLRVETLPYCAPGGVWVGGIVTSLARMNDGTTCEHGRAHRVSRTHICSVLAPRTTHDACSGTCTRTITYTRTHANTRSVTCPHLSCLPFRGEFINAEHVKKDVHMNPHSQRRDTNFRVQCSFYCTTGTSSSVEFITCSPRERGRGR